MKPMRNIGVTAIIIVAVLAIMAPGHGGGGGGDGGFVETSDPIGEIIVETGEASGQTNVTGEAFGQTNVTGEAFGQTSETGEAFGQTSVTGEDAGEAVFAVDPKAAAAAHDFFDGLDLNALTQNAGGTVPEGLAQALNDLDSYQGLAKDVSKYALQNYQDLQVNPAAVVDLLSNLPAEDIDQDALKQTWQIPSAADYAKMPAPQAQSTLAQLTVNFTLELQLGGKQDYLGLLDAIANQGALVEAAAANALGNILDPATLADAPLTEQGLQNLVASVSDDLSNAFLKAAQIITADYGIAEFDAFSVDATLFDTLDYSDVPAIKVNPLVLQLYG